MILVRHFVRKIFYHCFRLCQVIRHTCTLTYYLLLIMLFFHYYHRDLSLLYWSTETELSLRFHRHMLSAVEFLKKIEHLSEHLAIYIVLVICIHTVYIILSTIIHTCSLYMYIICSTMVIQLFEEYVTLNYIYI